MTFIKHIFSGRVFFAGLFSCGHKIQTNIFAAQDGGMEIIMKKFLAVMLVSVLAVSLVLSGCGSTPSTTPTSVPASGADDSLQKIKDKGTIVVGLDVAFPPMGFQDENNEIVGFDVDLAKAVGEILGVKVELRPIDWKSKELELKSGKVDLLWNGYTITDERKQEVLFSNPYLKNKQIIIVKNDSPIKAKADIVSGKVGLQTGSTAEDAIMADAIFDQIKSNLMMYDDNNTAMMDLEAGRVSSVVVDEVVGKYYLSQNTGKYRILDEDFGDEEYGVGFRLGDKALRDAVQEAIDTLKTNGKGAEISTKWFGQPDLIL